MTRFWLARICVTLRSCVSAGLPSRIASLRLSGLPASAVPNSLMISDRRWRKGSRSVFWTRSVCTVCSTWLAGTSGSGSSVSSSSVIGGPAGSQEMKYSAISDCGSEEQRVSSPRVPSSPVSSTVTIARLAALMSRSVTSPGVDAGDPHVGPGHEAEGVVHLDLVGVRVVGAGGRREPGDRGGDQREDECDPPHGPGST